MEAPVIGIDLGTTFSCVAVFKDDKAHVIEVKDEVKTMASVVSYTEDGRIIGNSAKENFSLDPASTVCGVKRFMGQRYKDLKKENLKNYPVEIINENDCPRFKVYFRGDEHYFSPEEVSASILETLKACADEYLDTDVKRVVITVPAHFNEAQRQATIDAGRIAGLEVLRIINEPTAAALAYGIHEHYKSQQKSCNILVYDFGGGTFDVSIINIDDGIFEVKATNGDTQLGGDDIDQLIVDHFVKKFETKYNTSLEFERRAIRRLRVQSEKLKKVLSNKDKASIDIPDLTANFDLDECMTRSEFEAICIPFIEKTLDLVQVALDDAKLKVSEIDEVVLVGGSTKINKVREMLKDFFEGKTLNLSLNPDEAIAIGASIQAAILDKESAYSEVIGSLLLLDVNSLSLGVQTLGRIMSVLIPRNTQIPSENTKTYYTAAPNQTNMSIAVYEGERKKVSENTLLGKFRFDGITPAPTGDIPVYITFNINTDGILKVTAVEKNNNIVKSIDIDMQKNSLSNANILAMIEKANQFRAADKEWEENTRAKNKLNLYCADILHFKKNLANRMTDEQCSKLTQKCDEVLEWLTNHKNESKNTYEEKRKEVFNICNPIVKLFS